MISSRIQYNYYLDEDRKALGIDKSNSNFSSLFFNNDSDVWRFQKSLRRCEYLYNLDDGSLYWKFKKYLAALYFKRLSIKLGFTIMPNCIGPGLRIMHRGTIVINGGCKIGSNCTINVDVNIGTNAGYINRIPHLGNDIYIGPGAKIYGDIFIADGCAIGANAVVNKSFLEKGTLILGVPAVSKGILKRKLRVY
jgi:serine O-acetyltransferase